MSDKRHQNDSHLSPTSDGLLHRQQPLPFLPDELIFQILLLLPVRSLLLFKCVCKSWKTLISTPQFAKTHLSSLTINPSLSHQQLFSSRQRLIGSYHLKYESRKILCIPVKPLFQSPSEPTKPIEFSIEHRFLILGSCNGLLCILDLDQVNVKLWNPSIRFESKKSPTFDCYAKLMNMTYCGYGFGYDHINDKYKVLVVLGRGWGNRFNVGENMTIIYTFGGNSWTIIQNFPYGLTTHEGKFVSGTLNWLIVQKSVILSFDLAKETHKEVLLPKHEGVDIFNTTLGVLSNCLCVCFDSNKSHWDIWLMKKYGVVESWTRLTIIPREQFQKSLKSPSPSSIEPLVIFGNSIVLFKTYCKFVMYNLNNGSFDCLPGNIATKQHIYHESLVSPQL